MIIKSFKYRLYPTIEQQKVFEEWILQLKNLWNIANKQRFWMLSKIPIQKSSRTGFEIWPSNRNQICKRTGNKIYGQEYEAQELARLDPNGIGILPAKIRNSCLEQLDKSWKRFYKNVSKKPKFKTKKDKISFTIKSNCNSLLKNINNGKIQIIKLGFVKVKIHRKLEGRPLYFTITKDSIGEWYVSITCEIINFIKKESNQIIGIDRGVKNIVADSNGKIIPSIKILEKSKLKLNKLRRKFSKQKKGSENSKKTLLKINKLNIKQINRRNDFYHKITSYYSNNNSTIVLEELKIKEMTKKGSKKTKLNSLIRSSAWKLLENQFKYKLNWYQKNGKLILIKPYNTSRICFKCKYCEKTNRKEDVFKCLKCGHEDHADINAAKNILFFGTK